MHANIDVLNKQLSALALALLFVAFTAGLSRAQPISQGPDYQGTKTVALGDTTATPLNGGDGGGGGGEGGSPEEGYERAVEDRPALGINAVAEQPSEAAVVGNYPNPFNPETTIRFEVRAAQPVQLAVYNVLGQRVRVLVDGWAEAGTHEARFEASGLPSGTYFSRLITEAGIVTRTMVLAR